LGFDDLLAQGSIVRDVMDDNPSGNSVERAQASRLREQARAGGLRFEAYLPPDLADWLLGRIEAGRFADPSEAVFAIVGETRDLEPHGDLRGELLRRRLEAAGTDLGAARPADEVFHELQRELAKPLPEPARWQQGSR
jgi:Arc/MetJ-type ribon-helix-helix transcriptional regulator